MIRHGERESVTELGSGHSRSGPTVAELQELLRKNTYCNDTLAILSLFEAHL